MIKFNIKEKIVNFLYKCIEFVERIEYRNIELDENDISKKIIEHYEIDNYQVLSDNGFVDISEVNITQPYQHYKLELENGYSLNCADNHRVYTDNLKEIFTKDLKVGDLIYTDTGYSKVKYIERLNRKTSMGDLSVDSPEHRYYTNGILSHNTISAAIAILYYCIFNNDKTVMIAANKKATTDEIVDKIKSIYYLLPYWLKPGVVNWNKSQITFGDTNCKIRSATATKTAAIGFTIDFLYLDEFAHVANNIAEDFYRSIFPTVSAVENSKIIITSTPHGYNLFWKLLSGAEKPEGDRDKNRFASMRVYWSQVPGRFVTYLRLNESMLNKIGVTEDEVYEWVKNMGYEEEIRNEHNLLEKEGLKMVENHDLGKFEIHIPNKEELVPKFIRKEIEDSEWDSPLSEYYRSLKYEVGEGDEKKSYKLMDMCEISSWKEDAVKNIGSLEAFNQEYDLQFLAGSRTLLDSVTMDRVKNGVHEFEHLDIPKINNKSYMDYSDLKWIKDRPDLFNMAQARDYFIIPAIDLSEGLGGDYSVVNIFRLVLKKEEDFPLNFSSMYDFFKLEQIGMFRSNTTEVKEIAELCYLLFFEVFDENKIGSVLEVNAFGGEFLKDMQNIFNGRNQYSSHVFFRYKHRLDALKPKIGIKLRTNKNQFIKLYQKRIRLNDIVIRNLETLQEMTTFIKKDTASGYKYEAESGSHDDIMMTVVETASVWDNYKFHEMCGTLFDMSPDVMKTKVRKLLDDAPNIESMDYNVLFNAQRAAATQRALTGMGTPTGGGNPYLGNNSAGGNNPYINDPWKNVD